MVRGTLKAVLGTAVIAAFLITAEVAFAEQLTLEECVNIALHKNASILTPGLKVNLSQAEQGVWDAWGKLLPAVNWNVDYQYFDPKFFDARIGDFTSSRYSTSLDMQQTLFDGFANIFSLRRSYQDRRAAQESYRASELTLILDVKTRYFTLLKNQKLVEVQKDAVKRAKEQLKTVQSRYDLGSASMSEVLKAKVQVGTERLALLNAENNVKVARADLNRIMNRNVNTPLEVTADIPRVPQELTLDRAEEYALGNQPQFLSAKESYRSSRSNLLVARATWYPTLTLRASRQYNTTIKSEWFAFRGDRGIWAMFVNLSIPVFSSFTRKTANATANVQVRASREAVEQAKNEAMFAVREAYLAYELAQQTTELATETEASAQEDFKLAQEKYNLGAATILDILNAQESLTRAKTDRVNADFDLALAVARLDNAMGKGL